MPHIDAFDLIKPWLILGIMLLAMWEPKVPRMFRRKNKKKKGA